MTNEQGRTPTLGDTIEALCRDGVAIARDSHLGASLAGSRLERVLVRAGNARLAMALADLAGELAPTASRRRDLSTADLFSRAA